MNVDPLKDKIRAAGGRVHSDGNIFFTNAEQFVAAATGCADPVLLSWVDAWDCIHTMHLPRAKEVLKELFNRWPGGFEEIESALRQMPEEVERLRGLAATCYAGLGAECNLPESWLDVFSAAANGEPFASEALLPFKADPPATNSAQADAIRSTAIHEAIAAIADTESRAQALAIMEGMLKQ